MATRLVLIALVLPLLGEPAPAPRLSPAEVARAVERLGSEDSTDRERATDDLWRAGRAAEPAVREAAKSGNPEVARRALDILSRFDAGLYPDTPKDVVELIRRYRTGNRDARMGAVQALCDRGPHGAVAAFRQARSEPDLALRHRLVGELDRHAGKLAAALVADRLEEDTAALFDLLVVYHANAERGGIQNLAGRPPGEQDGGLARLLLAAGELEAARTLADRGKVRRVRGQILFQFGDWATLAREGFGREAADGLESPVSPPEGPEEGRMEGIAFRAAFCRLAGDAAGFERAVKDIREWATRKGGAAAPRAAKYLLGNDRPADALAVLQAGGHHRAFDLLVARGAYREALGMELRGWPEWELRKAELHVRLGQREEARKVFDGYARRVWEKNLRRYLHTLIGCSRRAGLTDEAHAHCARLLALGPDLPEVWAGGAAFPDLSRAAHHLLRAWRRRNPDADWRVGLRLLDRGPQTRPLGLDFTTLIDDLLRSDPDRLPGWVRQAVFRDRRVRERAGADDLARRCHLARYVGAADSVDRPGHSGLWEAGDSLARQGRWAEAADQYAVAFRETQHPASAYLLGHALVRCGRADAGRAIQRWAVRVGPGWVGFNPIELARVVARCGAVEEADRLCARFAVLSRAVAWSPMPAFHVRAESAAGRGEYALAAEFTERARLYLLMDPFELGEPAASLEWAARVHRYRALGHLTRGDVGAAVREARLALRLRPGDPEVPLALVPYLDLLGRVREADEVFGRAFAVHEQVCADFPRAAGHHATAARLAAGCGRELDRGLAHAERAVALEPDNPECLGALADVQFRWGQKGRAIELARRCVELRPGDEAHRERLKRFLAGRDRPGE